MTRLDRILNLLEKYDNLAMIGVDRHTSTYGRRLLDELRLEKTLLTQELIAHGCRRKR